MKFLIIRNLNTKKLYATLKITQQRIWKICRSPERALWNVAGRENGTLYGSILHINVSKNVARLFLYLIYKDFIKKNNLHKVFNWNNVKISYSCTENISSIIPSYNKIICTKKKMMFWPATAAIKQIVTWMVNVGLSLSFTNVRSLQKTSWRKYILD